MQVLLALTLPFTSVSCAAHRIEVLAGRTECAARGRNELGISNPRAVKEVREAKASARATRRESAPEER